MGNCLLRFFCNLQLKRSLLRATVHPPKGSTSARVWSVADRPCPLAALLRIWVLHPGCIPHTRPWATHALAPTMQVMQHTNYAQAKLLQGSYYHGHSVRHGHLTHGLHFGSNGILGQ